MIISRTPFRISLFGGGSDLPAFYRRSSGAVLSATISKYMYISAHPYWEPSETLIKYSRTELCGPGQTVEHPIVRECLRHAEISAGIEITSTADIPAGTGLGSSSTFTVGLLNTLSACAGRFASKQALAETACRIEIDVLGAPIGKQDQFAAAVGGPNLIEFHSNGQVSVTPLTMNREVLHELERRLVLVYTGGTRDTNAILADQQQQLCAEEKFQAQQRMVELTYHGRDALYAGDLDRIGELLHANWILKRQLSPRISSGEIDELYRRGLAAGASGGKLLGAGGGGFLLFYCPGGQARGAVEQAFSQQRQMHVEFEYEGSQIVYADPRSYQRNQSGRPTTKRFNVAAPSSKETDAPRLLAKGFGPWVESIW